MPTRIHALVLHSALGVLLALLPLGLLLARAPTPYVARIWAAQPISTTEPISLYLPLLNTPPTVRSTTLTTTTITIPAHAYDAALVRKYSGTYNMFYDQLDRSAYDPTPVVNRTFRLLVLENEYLRLSILPELGGRIYQVTFKPTQRKLFYQNPVLKPSPWGPPEMGWWLAAGGIEWCLPVEEHGYEWNTAWQYSIASATNGITVTLSDSAASNRLRARIAISLRDGEALFHVAPTVENPTPQAINFKFWLNAMLAPGTTNAPSANLRFSLANDQVIVHSTGDSRLPPAGGVMSWSLYNGVDWSRLGNWRQWFGFFAYPQAAEDFQAVYDERDALGVVRVYDRCTARGAKFFAFGWGSDALSPSLYTDDGSSYVEMHGGLAPTFADAYRLDAGQSVSWDEHWYPTSQLGGVTWANERVALYVERGAGTVRLHVLTPRAEANVQVRLLRRSDGATLFADTTPQVSPVLAYQSPLVNTSLSLDELSVQIYADGALIGTYQ